MKLNKHRLETDFLFTEKKMITSSKGDLIDEIIVWYPKIQSMLAEEDLIDMLNHVVVNDDWKTKYEFVRHRDEDVQQWHDAVLEMDMAVEERFDAESMIVEVYNDNVWKDLIWMTMMMMNSEMK